MSPTATRLSRRSTAHAGHITQFAHLLAISAPLLFVCWMIFVGTLAKWELLVGMGVAVIGGVAICVVERADESRFRPRLRDVMQLAFVPWLLVEGTYEILWVSVRDLCGGRRAVSAFRVVRFDAGKPRDAHHTARRVLAVAGTTMAPNFIVFGINCRGDQLVFHQIERSGVPEMTRRLGACG